jgi:SAM-dependent methyltransferase
MPTKQKNKPKSKTKNATKTHRYTAATADRHELYQLSVQNVESEIDFVDATFTALRDRPARLLREDFAGTANSACEWVRRRETNSAIAVDLDEPTLEWGRTKNVAALDEAAQARIHLECADVRTPSARGRGVDIVLAMNFSYWILETRSELRGYFESVHESLADDGIFFLDFYGGSDAMTETKETRKINRHLTYIWEQARYDPISGHMDCKIHFKFPDGSMMKNAFEYSWRLWTLPEVRELLTEAGFEDVQVYWEGTDEDDPEEGNGEFEAVKAGDADPAYICYIVAQKKALRAVEAKDRPE